MSDGTPARRVPSPVEEDLRGRSAHLIGEIKRASALHTQIGRAEHERKLADKAVATWINATLATAPLLTPGQRAQIAAAFSAPGADQSAPDAEKAA